MDEPIIQKEINKYKKFRKVDGATYRKVNHFLRKRTYITAREWALARLCTDFRTSGGAEMTFIGKHLPELVPFMEDTYTPQAVNQARHSFKKKVRKASATFFYGAMCGFFTTDELDDLLFEASEVSRFLLEVEGTTLNIDEEIDIEDRITKVMRSIGETAKTILTARSAATDAGDSAGRPAPEIPGLPSKSRRGRKKRAPSVTGPEELAGTQDSPDTLAGIPSQDAEGTSRHEPERNNPPAMIEEIPGPADPSAEPEQERDVPASQDRSETDPPGQG